MGEGENPKNLRDWFAADDELDLAINRVPEDRSHDHLRATMGSVLIMHGAEPGRFIIHKPK